MASQSLNKLGKQNLSAFATYGYCAGPHLDQDDCKISGWVLKHPGSVSEFHSIPYHNILMVWLLKVPCTESNFVWTDYKLIVELTEVSHWYWNVPHDLHDATMNVVNLPYAAKISQYAANHLSRSDLLPSKLPGTWGSIPKFGIQSLDLGCNPYASWTWTWPPNKVPLTCKPPGLRNTCLGHTIQLLINSGFIPEPSKHSTHQSLHLPSFLCNPDFPTSRL